MATVIALVLGSLLAAAVARTQFFRRDVVSFLVLLPMALPGIVTVIALRSSFVLLGVDFSMWTIAIAHATFCVVIVYNNVVARLRRNSPSIVEASADLGASGLQTFRYIVLPNVATAVLAGGILASRSRSTRSSSRPSPPVSSGRFRSGSSARCSARDRSPSRTWSRSSRSR